MARIVLENIDSAQLGQHRREKLLGGSRSQAPAVAKLGWHEVTDIGKQLGVGRWEVDAYEPANTVFFHGVQDHP